MKQKSKITDINEYKNKSKNNNKGRDKKKFKVKKRIKRITFAVSAISICLINIGVYIKSSELKYDIYYLKEELREQEIILENNKDKLNKNISISNIEEEAKLRLGMDYPAKSQIEYIQIEE